MNAYEDFDDVFATKKSCTLDKVPSLKIKIVDGRFYPGKKTLEDFHVQIFSATGKELWSNRYSYAYQLGKIDKTTGQVARLCGYQRVYSDSILKIFRTHASTGQSPTHKRLLDPDSLKAHGIYLDDCHNFVKVLEESDWNYAVRIRVIEELHKETLARLELQQAEVAAKKIELLVEKKTNLLIKRRDKIEPEINSLIEKLRVLATLRPRKTETEARAFIEKEKVSIHIKIDALRKKEVALTEEIQGVVDNTTNFKGEA